MITSGAKEKTVVILCDIAAMLSYALNRPFFGGVRQKISNKGNRMNDFSWSDFRGFSSGSAFTFQNDNNNRNLLELLYPGPLKNHHMRIFYMSSNHPRVIEGDSPFP
jgi:hypothetical protein